jgi:MMPL family
VHVTGPAGNAADSIKAFDGFDSVSLYGTIAVVVVILVFTYRSPVLWLLPVISAGVALTVAQAVIYLLARHAGLTVNAQSLGLSGGRWDAGAMRRARGRPRFAAAVGDLPLVERYLNHGAQQSRSGASIGVHGPVLDPQNMTGYALIYAAGFGRQDVVRLLLTRKPDLTSPSPSSAPPRLARPATTDTPPSSNS